MYNPQLDTFVTVAERGSFTKAAEELCITPTAVIKQINLLESKLGLKLFGKIAEQGRGRFGVQKFQQIEGDGVRKRGKFFRHVGGMEVFRRFGKGLETAIFGQFTENEQNILTGHGMIPLCILLKGKRRDGGTKVGRYCRGGFPWKAPFRLKVTKARTGRVTPAPRFFVAEGSGRAEGAGPPCSLWDEGS